MDRPRASVRLRQSSNGNASYLVIDETPLFQKSMHPHDCTHIASEIPSTRSDCLVFNRIESIRVDHEVAIVLVYSGCFASVSTIEELGQ